MSRSAAFGSNLLSRIAVTCAVLVTSLCAIQIKAANVLGNPGFECGNFGGWITFGANNYILTGAATAHSGTNSYKVYQVFNGALNDTGIYQDTVSGSGATYSADGWAYTSSGDVLAGQNIAWIEVTFRDGAGNILALYRSALVTTNAIANGTFPKNTWVDLAITNQYDPNLLTITNTVTSLTAPAGTCLVRYQITFQGDPYNSSGSTYFDDLTLNQLGTEYGPNWNIVWSDEFNGTSLNTNNWTYDIGNGFYSGSYFVSGWGNGELEYYNSSTQNVYVANGLLHIHALIQSMGGCNYTSGRIKSTGLFSKMYGRFEWRAKLPSGTGFWPALWMLPATSTPYGGWPDSGEIDVMENNGSTLNQEGGTIHYGGVNGNDTYSGKTYTFMTGDSVTNFHTYLLEWSTNSIKWYVDGHLYENQTSWFSSEGGSTNSYPYPAPFNYPFYIIMNLAIGGNYLGNPAQSSINPNMPGEMQVDYIRVYDQTTPLQISAATANGKVVLSWPTNIVCHLQTQTNLLGTWSDVSSSTNPFVITPASTNRVVFYRLESP